LLKNSEHILYRQKHGNNGRKRNKIERGGSF
jgi:hypothetical protein